MAEISSITPLFMLSVRDRQESRYYYTVMRAGHSPHTYDWRSMLMQWDGRSDQEDSDQEDSDQRYQHEFISRQCFTDDEASVIERHVQMLGCHSERTPVSLPTNYGPSDACGNVWQYRDFWEEGALPCAIRYTGYFGVETQVVQGLLPDDYFDITGGVEGQLPLWERENEG